MGPRTLALVVAMMCAGCLADTLLLWPPKGDATYPELRRMLPDDGGAVEVFVSHATADEPEVFVLAMFGNGQVADASAAQLAEALGNSGLRAEVWGVNYAGYGRSQGRATLDGVARATRRGYAELAKRAAGKPIIVFGASLGTAAALDIAAHEHVAGAVLINPPPLPELVLRRFGWWNLFLLALPVALQIPEALDSVPNAALATAPALFLSATDDEVVPASYQQRVMDAYNGPWRRFSLVGAGHNDPLPEAARLAIVAAMQRWISADRATASAW